MSPVSEDSTTNIETQSCVVIRAQVEETVTGGTSCVHEKGRHGEEEQKGREHCDAEAMGADTGGYWRIYSTG